MRKNAVYFNNFRTALLMLSIFVFININAQNKTIKQADEYFNNGQFYNASYLYKKILDKQFDDRLAYKYAEACRLDYNLKEAEKYYKQVLFNNKFTPEKLYFNLATVQKGLGKYIPAKQNFNKFINIYPKNDFLKQKAKHELLSCEKALELSFKSTNVLINRLPDKINTKHGELKLVKFDSIDIFTAFRNVSDNNNNNYYIAKLFYLKDSIVKQITIPKHEFDDIPNFTINDKTNKIYLTICQNKAQGKQCKIWKADFNNLTISNLTPLSTSVNFPGSNSTQPSVCHIDDKDYMFFSSDRSGGYGKYDIWVSELYEDGNPSSAKNLGENINSPDDEITPFYDSKQQILYYSSKWFDNLGGFDIFKSNGDLDYFSAPENMGNGINSSYNDYYYVISKNTAIFSSNRKGSIVDKGGLCCNDFYKYKIPENKQENKQEQIAQLKTNIRQLIPITLYFHNDEPNPKTRDTTTNLSYEQTYKSYINLQETYEKEYSSGLSGQEKLNAINKIDDFFEDKINANYIKLRKFTYLLKELLENGETIKITIKGFASPLNTSDYNTNLSKRRIQSLVNYFNTTDNGYFRKYINKADGKGIIFERIAFGEDKADKNISDSYKDVKNSIYSPAAANERKIKVLAISFE